VLIVSDSHGLTKELGMLRERHLQDVDLMIHCGDSELMPDHPSVFGFLTVMGNCDIGGYPLETITEAAGRRIFITHGHKYSVKTSLMSLKYKAIQMEADIVCFGHSHILGAELIGGILFLNPGSIRLPRERFEKTYLILEILEEKIRMQVFDLSGHELRDLYREFIMPK